MKKTLGLTILKHFILDGCEVKVADVTPLAAPGMLDKVLPLLSKHRRDKTLRYRFERGKMLSAGAGLLLDNLLREQGLAEAKMQYTEGEHGKPEFAHYPDLHFSISHSGTLVACAIGDVPLGVDVQTIVTPRDGLIDYTMNEIEKSHLASLTTDEEKSLYFTQLWTLKESYAKATGIGLSHDFPAFEIVDDVVRPLTSLDPLARFHMFTLDGAAAALAILD